MDNLERKQVIQKIESFRRLNKEDLKIETYVPKNIPLDLIENRSFGVKITHIPTGITEQCSSSKSQIKNQYECLKKIVLKLFDTERTRG